MAQSQMHTVCSDCIAIFREAATVLSSESAEEEYLPFGASHRTRLTANVSQSKCHMCLLLNDSIPRLLEPPDPEELLLLNACQDRHDTKAVNISLVGSNDNNLDEMTLYTGSVRIQDGKYII